MTLVSKFIINRAQETWVWKCGLSRVCQSIMIKMITYTQKKKSAYKWLTNVYYKWLIKLHSFYVLEPPRANASISESMQCFDDVILDFMTEQDIPGASVALSRHGNLLYCQGKWKNTCEISCVNLVLQLLWRYQVNSYKWF